MTVSRPPRAILFDKDGTIIDYARTWIPINREVALFAAGGDMRLAAELLRHGGQDPVANTVTPGTPLAAGSVEEIAANMAERLGARTPANFTREIDRIFREGGARFSVLLEGASDALAELKRRGFEIGLATNDTIGGLEASLSRHPVRSLFAFAVGCDSGHGAKPGPGMVEAFARATGFAPADMAIVGDSTHDLEMGRKAGAAHLIGVLCGTGRHADLARHATLLLADIAAMLEHPLFAAPP